MIRLRSYTACILLMAAALEAAAQEHPGLSLSNPALLHLVEGRRWQVSLDGQKDNGKLISLSESPDSFEAGGKAEAYNRVSPMLSFHGKLSWNFFQGQNMGGQVLLDPYYNPVNFLESTEETKGRKHRERYFLEGGLACRLSDRWTAGFDVSYESADLTKVKDPRFSNIWMDIDVHAGVTFRPGKKWLLGLSLQYRNTLEQIKGGVYGTTNKQYFIFTDKGNFLGTTAELDGDFNAISTSSLRPMSNQFFGAAIQTVLDDRFAGELWFQTRSGYYGRKSSTTATFYEFGGIRAGYDAKLQIPAATGLHKLDWTIGFENLSSSENKFRYVTPEGQNTIVDYLGQDIILRRIQASAQIGYSWNKGQSTEPGFSVGGQVEGRFRTQTAEIFPYTRKQQVISLGADVFGARRFQAGKSLLTVEMHALAGGGMGTPKEDEIVPGASTTLKSFDNYLFKQYEFETAWRAGGQLALTWTCPMGWKCVPYIRLSEQYIHLMAAPQYLEGASRNTAMLSIGLIL